MSVTLSIDQAKAISAIGAWYRSRSAPYITLGGYAGTGKTTLSAYVRRALNDLDDAARVAFCAYTGKATRVLTDRLRAQGAMRRGDSISTIHSLIYTGDANSWVLKDPDKLGFNLIIVDEASMVDEAIWRDLLSFKIPILAVGDHGQLPPVGSTFSLMKDPQLRLERIFRQEAESPIIEVATLARQTGVLPVREFGAGVRKLDRTLAETGQTVEELLGARDLMVLCGYNATRVKLNAAMRGLRDMESPEPQSGDVVVCLRNNRARHIYNGMLGRIRRVTPITGEDGTAWYDADIELDGEDYGYSGYILQNQFGAMTTAKDVPVAPNGERGDIWDFGYALTVHKAQGSQAPRVLVFEERFAKGSEEEWRRWLYTAVTRAETELTIVGANPDPQA